jgi:hypothetical protein
LIKYRDDFLLYINYHNKNKCVDLLDFIYNKNILIYNNLSELMKKQYDSGNIKKICRKFPDIKSLNYLTSKTTFFNTGPDTSILDTCSKECNHIGLLNFDVIIISCGAYSSLIFDYVTNHLKKEAFVIGGNLPLYFGLATKRIKLYHPKHINEYFIEIPDEYKPECCNKIENACYW